MFARTNADVVEAFRNCGQGELITQLNADFVEDCRSWGARLYKALPHPLVFDRGEFETLAFASNAIMEAQLKIARHLERELGRAGLLSHLRIDLTMEPFILWERLQISNSGIARIDILPNKDSYSVCEINIFGGVGGREIDRYWRAFAKALKAPAIDTPGPPFDDLAYTYSRMLERHPQVERLVLLDWSGHASLGYPDFQVAKTHLQAALPELAIYVHDDTDYPQEWLSPAEGRRTLIHRVFTFDDLAGDLGFLTQLYESDAIMSNGMESELLMNKRWFVMLTDPLYHELLTSDEIEAIQTFIPRTIALTTETLDNCIRQKQDWVFKADTAYGGQGVLVGRDAESELIRSTVLRDGVDQWTCQRYCPVDTLMLPVNEALEPAEHTPVLGLFIHGGLASGVLVRASATSRVVNATTGAKLTWATPMWPKDRERLIAHLYELGNLPMPSSEC